MATLPLASALLLSPGCALLEDAPQRLEYARPYPGGQAVETLDIQVEREGPTVRFTNTSARSFGESTMWINGGFSRPLEPVAIGESVSLDLRTFVDEYGNAFRGGGFFATRVPHDLVLAEIEEADGQRFGLIVIRGEAE